MFIWSCCHKCSNQITCWDRCSAYQQCTLEEQELGCELDDGMNDCIVGLGLENNKEDI